MRWVLPGCEQPPRYGHHRCEGSPMSILTDAERDTAIGTMALFIQANDEAVKDGTAGTRVSRLYTGACSLVERLVIEKTTQVVAEVEAEEHQAQLEADYADRHGDHEDDCDCADEACPGCGCMPGEGRTDGCEHPDGCGFNHPASDGRMGININEGTS